ncbi:MAG: SusC/RagA family TonB-linked outer membrane protein [Bacteroidetes bacterium]|nr:MAG: SusC/RagA family TonB-linked outer membrane protein [Bacteroidota bacterium]
MRKFTLFLAFMFFLGMQVLQAQDREISGTVTSSDDGLAIPGVQVVVKGTTIGTVTGLDGNYKLNVPESATMVVFSFIGMVSQEVEIGSQTTIDLAMEPDILNIEGVVVTALGISREKKSLGYATQEITGDDVNQVKSDNFINSMSGKISGVQVKNNTNIGGSSNVIIRGSTSLTGNNQALFVVDGIPISNDLTNNDGQTTGRSGYDYGSAASDINPNDIESINVLKGAAATALYGSRAANGVILITTKKGSKSATGSKLIGVGINSNVTVGYVDKSTFPKYQQSYGAGYGPYYSGGAHPGLGENADGDLVVPFTEDASFGEAFDPSLMVYQYNAYEPTSPNFGKKTPWVAGENGPIEFFDNSLSLTNSVDVTGGGENNTFRLSYTNMHQKGIMPNSELNRNNFNFSGSHDVLDNLTLSASANVINTNTKGRNHTGYSDNIMSSFRQWWQTNVDMNEQQDLYDQSGTNATWNRLSEDNADPIYWDNFYWSRFENYQTDERNRIIGYVMADWQITDYISLMGRVSMDQYSLLQEERKAIGSVSGEFGVGRPDVRSGYARFNRSFMETNVDIMANYNKNITEDISLQALIGVNLRKTTIDDVYASTNGGLIVPDLYSLGNSVSPMLAPEENLSEIGVNGIFGSASLGYKNMIYLDATIRRDVASTLPEDANSYIYPSVSTSFVFSELLEANWLSFGKVRLNYAEVGNAAGFARLTDTYDQNTSFNGNALFSLPNSKNNAELKPERSKSFEVGLAMTFLQNRLGFDVAYYKTNTVDQLMPVAVSYTTGYSTKYINAGEMENKGIELMLNGTPMKGDNFRWDVNLNWAQNKSLVVSLADGVDNLQLARLQGGVTINARVGEAYGTIQGTDFVTDASGNKVVGSNGYYLKTATSDQILGDINPDWIGGLNNRFSYKNWAFSFLIDWQEGGSVFSLDQYYGLGTGLYAETVFTNDLGNPVRNDMSDGGGLVLPGVKEDGSVNDIRVSGNDYRVFGWSKNPNAAFVYSASYVKLREVVLTYSLPAKMMEDSKIFTGVSFSLVGSNLWILYKELPHADPEASQGAGNIQGWQSGAMPATRNVGFSVNLQF